ncbi:Mss4-like protein [Aspergillus floccosus]
MTGTELDVISLFRDEKYCCLDYSDVSALSAGDKEIIVEQMCCLLEIFLQAIRHCHTVPAENLRLRKEFHEWAEGELTKATSCDMGTLDTLLEQAVSSAEAYYSLGSYEVQLIMAKATALAISLDNNFLSPKAKAHLPRSQNDLWQRKPPSDQWSTVFSNFLAECADFFGEMQPSVGTLAAASWSQWVEGCLMEDMLSGMLRDSIEGEEQRPIVNFSPVEDFPYHVRTLTGAPLAYCVPIFKQSREKEIPYSVWMSYVPAMTTVINLGNDLFSYPKEVLDGEKVNYVSLVTRIKRASGYPSRFVEGNLWTFRDTICDLFQRVLNSCEALDNAFKPSYLNIVSLSFISYSSSSSRIAKMSSELKTLKASCHCRNVQFAVNIPQNALPLKVHLCHCNVCRQTHGSPCSFHAPLPSGVQPEFISPSSPAALTGYAHANSKSTRFFCSNCGCHIGDRDHDHNDWYLSVSIFDEGQQDGTWLIDSHANTDATIDGGLSALLPRIDDNEIPIWNPPTSTKDSQSATEKSDELLAQCHCGGVSFTISRPKAEFAADPKSRGWLHPSDRSKWLASVDVCDSCRLVNGTHVILWMFVPCSHITPTPPADLMMGTSKTYRSSDDVLRSFCGTCGATVFYTCADRPDIVDVASGILRAPEGAMAKNWAVWRTARLGFVEDGIKYDAAFARGLEAGLKKWGELQDGHVTDFVVGAETKYTTSP